MTLSTCKLIILALLVAITLISPVQGRDSDDKPPGISKLASSSVLRVPADYDTLQEAIDSALPYDLILVGDGNYTGNLEIANPLEIRSENGPNSTFLIATQASQHVVKILANHTKVAGITVTGATGMDRAGIYAYGVTNITISGNRVLSNYDGISLDRVGNSTVDDNRVAANFNGGILVDAVVAGSCVTKITSNEVLNNGGVGISLHEQAYQGSIMVEGNRVEGNGQGVEYTCAKSRYEGAGFGRDFISGNLIANNTGMGLGLSIVNVRMILEISGNDILWNGEGVRLEGVSTGGFNVSGNRISKNSGPAFNGSWINQAYNLSGRLIGAVFKGNNIQDNDGLGIGLTNIKTTGETCFSGNTLSNNSGSGIMVAGLKANLPIKITNNTIERNAGLGVELVSLKIAGENLIEGNLVGGNGGVPAFLDLPYWKDLVEDWESFLDQDLETGDFEGLGGVAFLDCTLSRLIFSENTVRDSEGTGMMFGGNVIVGHLEGNMIYNNSGHGLLLLDVIGAGNFSGNQVLDNGLSGVGMESGDDAIVRYDFKYNNITGNMAGLVLNGTTGSKIAHNNISKNRDLGVSLRGGTGNRVHNCTICLNMGSPADLAETKAGIYAWGEDVVMIADCDICGNYNGVVVDRGTDIQISDNTVDDNIGIGMDISAMFIGDYNISGNAVQRNGAAGIRLEQTSLRGRATVEGNYLSGNQGGLVYESKKGSYSDSALHRDVVSWNTVVNDSGPGMSLVFKQGEGYVTEIDHNYVSQNGVGLLISDRSGSGTVVRHNFICDNSGAGIMGSWRNGVFQSTDYWVYDPKLLEARYGMPYDGNSDEFAVIFQNNTISQNNGPGLALLGLSNGGGVPIINNTITYNNGTAILIPAAADGGPNPILDNNLIGNWGAGIELYELANGGASLVAGNSIRNNLALTLILDPSEVSIDQELVEGLIGGIVGSPEDLINDLRECLEENLEYVLEDLVDTLEYMEAVFSPAELGHQGGIFIISDSSGGYAVMNNEISNNGGDGISTLLSKAGLGLIEGNNITGNTGTGVRTLITKAFSGSVSWNRIEGSGEHGVWIFHSSSGERVIEGNVISDNALAGVSLGPGASDYNLTGNRFGGNGLAVYLNGTKRASISNNALSGGGLGLVLDGSVNCAISGNLVRHQQGPGIRIESGKGNLVWNNSLLGNNGAGPVFDSGNPQGEDYGEGNQWNASNLPGGWGNFWSDWKSPDVDSDGLVDLPYVLGGDAGSVDHHPLANPGWILEIPPLPPEDLRSAGGPLVINLSWVPPPGQGEEAPLKYNVYRGNSTHRNYLAEIPSHSTTYTDPGLTPGIPYHYHVTAVNSYGESSPSNATLAIAQYITTMPWLTITDPVKESVLGSDTIRVEWYGDGNGSPIEEFKVRMDGGAWVNVALGTGRTFEGLAEGSHTGEVWVSNKGGGIRIGTVKFVIDLTPPEIMFTCPVNGTVFNLTEVNVGWKGQDTTSAISVYRTRLDGGIWMNHGLSTSRALDNLADGDHNLELEALDMAGNTATQEICLRVDTTPPTVLAVEPVGSDFTSVSSISATLSEEMELLTLILDPGDISWQLAWDGLTATFVLDGEIATNVNYRAEITGRDRAGNALERYEWSFSIPDALVFTALLLFCWLGLGSRKKAEF